MSWSALSLAPPSSSSLAAGAALSVIAVDPWTHGINDGGGSNTYLSFPNAVEAVIAKAAGHNGAALGIAVTAASMTDFVGQLTALGSAFPLPSLSRLARRAAQMAALEISKMLLVPHQLHGGGLPLNAIPAIRAVQRADLIKQASDAAEAFKTSDANDNLTAFSSDKAAHAAFVSGVQAAASSGLSGGTGFRFYAPNNIASALRVGHPGHEFTLTAIQLFLGSAADLALLAEIVQ